ncbi:MAG: site-specific integrase [Rhodocyclaceae bacterium]|nr:site-specific integrase [Rhodocyclaceae bacterium]
MAAENKLSDRSIRAVRPSDKEQNLGDGGGLWLRLMPADGGGARSWYWRYTWGGKARRLNLGPYPAVSLAQARAKRDEARVVLASGRDPSRHVGCMPDALTVRQMAESWRDAVLAVRHRDKGAKVFGDLEHDLLATLGEQAAATVTHAQMVALIEDVARRAPAKATKTLYWCRALWAWGMRRQIVPADPVAGLRAADVGARSMARSRNLSWEEIAELAHKMPAAHLPLRIEAALWILLATGARVGELRLSTVQDLDLDAGEWKLRPEITKTGVARLVHLSPFAVRWCRVLLGFAESGWLLAGNWEGQPVSDEFLRKLVGDRISTVHRARSTKHFGALLLSGGPWRLHDLRRTMASRMGDLGVDSHVIEACLGHARRGIEGVYQRQQYLGERKNAFHLWGERLETLMPPRS